MSIKIGLDAGHGLYTAGKQTPDGIKEWTLNDKVRDRVVTLLADYDCEIINVDNDEGVYDETLATRVAAYTKAGARAFVSIHHNASSSTWTNVTGTEVYIDTNATAADVQLGTLIYNKMVVYTGLRGRGLKRQNFTVINQNTIPAVLVEGGFMNGTNDYKIITSESGQEAYAKAVADGLIEFLNLELKSIVAKTDDDVAKEIIDGLHAAGRNCASILDKAMNLLIKKAPEGSTVMYFQKYSGTTNSITTALKSLGIDSSFSNRTKIAEINGIASYSGTAQQNIALLNLLKGGTLIKP